VKRRPRVRNEHNSAVGIASALFLITIALAGCTDSEPSRSSETGLSQQAMETAAETNPTLLSSNLPPVPARVRRLCEKVQRSTRLAVLCPMKLPRPSGGFGPSSTSRLQVSRVGGSAANRYMIEVAYGVEATPQRKNAPSRFLHVLFAGGDLSGFGAPAIDFPPSKPPARFLGRRTISGRNGMLYLQRPYNEGGALHGNHFIFIWQRRGVRYGISLHAWRPESTLALLAGVIGSLQSSSE
jgi:hypothetical protein